MRTPRILSILFQTYCLLLLLLTYMNWGWTLIQAQPDLIRRSDFLATYTAATLLQTGSGQQLYQFPAQKAVQQTLVDLTVPPDNLLPFIHPPFFALPYLPLAYLPYDWAFANVFILNIILLGYILRFVWRNMALNIPLWSLCLASLAFFPCFVNLIQGQNAILSLVILTLVIIFLQQERDLIAGSILALSLYKPQLSIVFILIFLVQRRWRALLGFSGLAFLLVILSYSLVGYQGMIDYTNLVLINSPLVNEAYGVYYRAMHSWRGLFHLWFGPSQATLAQRLTVFTSLGTLLGLIWVWRGGWQPQSPHFALQLALSLIAMLLISPHLNTHDLTLWLLVGFLIIDDTQKHKPAVLKPWVINTLLIGGNLISFITILFHEFLQIKLTVVFMVGVACMLILEMAKTNEIRQPLNIWR